MQKICIIIAIVTAMLLSAVSCTASVEEKERLAEYELKLSELVYLKQQLMNERDDLDTVMEKALGNTSYMSLIFTQIDSALYTDVYPAMTEYDDVKLVGVLAFSRNELPGTDGNISVEQYEELVSLGWGTALYWNGEGVLADFVDYMAVKLGEINIELPKSMMFAMDAYVDSYDEMLGEYGIVNLIHSGGEDLDFVEKTEPDGAWHPGCIGWRWIGKSTLLKKAVENDGGYALFEIAFDNAKENTRTSYFPIAGELNDSNRPKIFSNMVRQLVTSVRSGNIEILNIDDTRARVERYYDELKVLSAANDIRREEIKEEIRDIERRMMDLYYEYH